MQVRTAERIALWRTCLRAAGNAGRGRRQALRKSRAFSKAGAIPEARREGSGGQLPRRDWLAMSTTPQPVPQENASVLQHVEDGLAILTLNRPDRMNAINTELATALNEALTAISTDKHVHAVVITGAGKGFCAGGDLKEIWEGRQKKDKESLEPLLRSGLGVVLKMRTLGQPVIAAVNGPAAGAGMNIALAADVRFAADNASFGESFAKVGLFPDFGGTYFLPQLVGHAKA